MRLIKILFVTTLLSLFTTSSFSETKDCSMYDNKTIVGTYDKWRCEKGKEPRKKFKQILKKLNPLSKN